MKSIAAAACLAFATSLLSAQTAAPVESKAPGVKPAETKPAATKPAVPAKGAATKQGEKKKEELPKIPGTVITRANGTLLGLEVSGGRFKLTFYDTKHKPMAMDVSRATARWPNPRAPGNNFTVLNGSGTTLVGEKPVVPPFTFTVFLTLLKGEGDEAKAVETYPVPFRG